MSIKPIHVVCVTCILCMVQSTFFAIFLSKDGNRIDVISEEFHDEIDDKIQGRSGPHTINDDDDDETKLLKRLANVARLNFEEHESALRHGHDPVEFIINRHQRWIKSEMALQEKLDPSKSIDVLQKSLEMAKEIESEFLEMFNTGIVPIHDVTPLVHHRIDIELQLWRAENEK